MTNLNFLSINVRGLSNQRKRRAVLSWCKHHKSDIIFLQETHSSVNLEKMWRREWGKNGSIIFSHGKTNARGSCILIKPNLNIDIHKEITDSDGRLILLKATVNNVDYVMVNLYAPNHPGKAIDFFDKVVSIMKSEEIDVSDNIIIGGDFNACLNPVLDRYSPKKTTPVMVSPQTIAIQRLMKNFEIQDIWRIKNPTLRSYTWCHTGKLQFSRIDFWLTSSHFQDSVNLVDFIGSIKSDHSAISLGITINNHSRGPGFWKFNTSLLKDENYIKLIDNLIKSLTIDKNNFGNVSSFWEWIKYNVRKNTIAFSKQKYFMLRKKEQELQNEVNKWQAIFEHSPSLENKSKLINMKNELEELYNKKVEGSILRAKVRWYEQGEKSTKYFLNLEKRNYTKKFVQKLLVNGNLINRPNDILKTQHLFYQALYTKDESHFSRTEFNNLLAGLRIPSLDENLKQSCEGEIMENECNEVLKSFQNGKSPGNDGIPIEFYKCFWSQLKPLLIEVYNESYKCKRLPLTQTQAVITLIEKKDVDRTLLKNWRPISLLNVDYKIMSKVIAYRLKKVLDKLIHTDQTAYVQGRYIGENIRLIEDIFYYTEQADIPGVLLCVDFEKAFDSLNWDFVVETLKVFGFGPSILGWFSLLYKDSKSCVLNNGFSTPYFNIQRGVRQGDPLSPYLFVLCAEILAILIRNDKNIKGLKIENEEIKISQFADDTTLFLQDSNSINASFKLLDKFGKLSGLKVNAGKTEAMWLGKEKFSNEKPFGIKWPISIKILGVYFCHDKKLRETLNFDKIPNAIAQIINLWKQRNLTLFGKIIIIKSLLLSKLTYKASLLSVPSYIIKEISQLVFKFLWKGPDKVKRNVITGEYKFGGLKMLNIEIMIKALKLSWISRFRNNSEPVWKKILDSKMKTVGGIDLFLHCNYDMKIINGLNLPGFYKDIFGIFLKDLRQNTSLPGPMVLWNNCSVLVEGKSVYYDTFYRLGIKYINDLFIKDNSLKSFNYWVEKGLHHSFWLQWYSLTTASKFKQLELNQDISSDIAISTSDNRKIIIKRNFRSKDFYNVIMVKNGFNWPVSKEKLMRDFNLDVDMLGSYYVLMHKIKVENKVKDLQYRILTSIYNTNVLLVKKKLKENSYCDFCKTEIETLYHLFFNCSFVQSFWKDLEEFFNSKLSSYIKLTLKDIILGNGDYLDIVNVILLHAKYYIHKTKIALSRPLWDLFWIDLKQLYKTERLSYQNKNKLNLFSERWPFIP